MSSPLCFSPSATADLSAALPVYWLLRHDRQLWLRGGEAPLPHLPADGLALAGGCLQVGEWGGIPVWTADLASQPELEGFQPVGLREVFALCGEAVFALAGRAVQLLDWQRQHRYCGACGTPTVRAPSETAMQCPACALTVYPRISPAIMVLVRDGDRFLLARSPRFKPGTYSALAGFVEAGETLEQCAAREVREEVGIEIANLRYFGSQPWPFPNSLMIAFYADYAGGEVGCDPVEIEDAQWFSLDHLPILPDPVSISRRLIDALLAELAALAGR